jgi:hypothetical protein
MPKKSKKDKRKKSRLSDKDIIKLLKKLRPKTQQIVKVNIGDKADKKKDSISQFAPNLVPVRTWAEPYSAQPPFQFPPALPPPLPMSQQPQLQPLLKPPIPPFVPLKAAPYESESETPVKVRKTRTSKTSRKATDYIDALAASASAAFAAAPETRFKAPRQYNESTLSASSSEPSFFQPPAQNDRYLQPIFEDTTRDSAGVVAQPLTSDEWTGTPEGVIADVPLSVAESTVAAVEAAAEPTVEPLETVPAPEETFAGRTIGSQSKVDKIRAISAAAVFAEEEPDWTKNVKIAELLPPTPPEPTAAPLTAGEVDPYLFNRLYGFDYMDKLVRDAPLTAQGLMKNEIVEKLKGGFTGVPKEYLTKTGRLRTKLNVNELFNLYMDL